MICIAINYLTTNNVSREISLSTYFMDFNQIKIYAKNMIIKTMKSIM